MAISPPSAGPEASGTSGTTITPSAPGGIQADDILIIVAACFLGSSVGSIGAGWTRIVENSNGSSFPSMMVAWCRYDGSSVPTATVTFSGSSGEAKIAAMMSVPGCKTSGSPFNQQSSDGTGTDNTIEHNSVTTTVDGCMLLCCNATDGNNTRTSLAASFTNIFEDTTAGTDNAYRRTDVSIHASYLLQATQGSTGSLVVSGSSLPGWTSVLLALEPAASGTSITLSQVSAPATGASLAVNSKTQLELSQATAAWNGQAVKVAQRVTLALASAWAAAGQAVAVNARTQLVPAGAGWSWTGAPIATNAPDLVELAQAAWSWSGQAVKVAQRVTLSTATWAWNGVAAAINHKAQLVLSAATWAWNGVAAGVNSKTQRVLSAATWAWTGAAVQVANGVSIVLSAATWAWTANAVRVAVLIRLSQATWSWIGRATSAAVQASRAFFRTVLRPVLRPVLRRWDERGGE